MPDTYTFKSRQTNHLHTKALSLSWEVHGTPISDDYDAKETDATELLSLWIKRCYPDEKAQALYGAGAVSIYWSVVLGDPKDGNQESAPFQANPNFIGDFLTHYSWPVHSETDQQLNWLTLPIAESNWTPGRHDKGGFFHQATGWMPSPLQPAVHLPTIIKAVPGLGSLLPATP